jgi:hypothetical protein
LVAVGQTSFESAVNVRFRAGDGVPFVVTHHDWIAGVAEIAVEYPDPERR